MLTLKTFQNLASHMSIITIIISSGSSKTTNFLCREQNFQVHITVKTY